MKSNLKKHQKLLIPTVTWNLNLKFESLRRFKFQSFTAGDSDAGPPPPAAGPDGVPEHEVQARERLKFKRGPATEPEVPGSSPTYWSAHSHGRGGAAPTAGALLMARRWLAARHRPPSLHAR